MRARRNRHRSWRIVGSLSLFGLVLSAPSREATGADAEQGYQYLLTKPYDAPLMTEAMLWDVWKVWPEPARTEAEHASPAERRQMIFSRYGLVEEQGRDLPVNLLRTPGGGLTENCLACHAGKGRRAVHPRARKLELHRRCAGIGRCCIDAAGETHAPARSGRLAGRFPSTAICQRSRRQQCVRR